MKGKGLTEVIPVIGQKLSIGVYEGTDSSIEPEQIHYMMARGFTPEDAQAAIVEGFLISSFAKMKNDTTRQFLLDALSKQTHE